MSVNDTNIGLMGLLAKKHGAQIAHELYRGLSGEFPQLNHKTRINITSAREVTVASLDSLPIPFPERLPAKGRRAAAWRVLSRIWGRPRWQHKGYTWTHVTMPSGQERTLTLRKYGISNLYGDHASVAVAYDGLYDTLYVYHDA